MSHTDAPVSPSHRDEALADAATRSAEAFRVGVEAYVWGYPLVVMARTRARFLSTKPVNTFSHEEHLTTPRSTAVVTPNNDTLYSIAWLDLRTGPVVLRVPSVPDRYYDFQLLDMYTDTFANIGSRQTGPAAGAYAVVGPGWQGRLPVGTAAIHSPTPDVWVIGRTLVDGPDDVAVVNAIQQAYALESMGAPPDPAPSGPAASHPPASPPPAPASLPSPHAVPAAGITFFDELGAAMAEDPPPPCAAAASCMAGPGSPRWAPTGPTTWPAPPRPRSGWGPTWPKSPCTTSRRPTCTARRSRARRPTASGSPPTSSRPSARTASGR